MQKLFSLSQLGRGLGWLLATGILLLGGVGSAAEVTAPVLERQSWSWTGPFGKYDKAAAQRGLQIYTQICSGCHSLDLVAFRDLEKIGYSENEIKGFAAGYQFDMIDDKGNNAKRRGLPSDYFPAPFANEQQARSANNGALPPDLSLIIKARNAGRNNLFVNLFDAITIRSDTSGADYLYALLIGYQDPPADVAMNSGMHYNKYFAGHQIAMAPPLSDGAVSYSDGKANNLPQLAHDVVTFLAFASEPNLEQARYTGLKVFMVLIVLFILVYNMKKRFWQELDQE